MSTLKSYIQSLNVDGATRFMEAKSVEELRNLLLEYAFDEKDVRVYTLMSAVIRRDPKWAWHYLTSLILCQPFCSIKGAYFAAYFHACEASRLDPNNVLLKEHALFFNGVPDKPMDDPTAKSVAEDLLEIDPDNEVAKRLLA
jgi:hypothetical protein